jgi:hypothetical protein
MSDEIVRAARDYVLGRHAPDWAAVLTRMRDATDSDEQKAFADEVIGIIDKQGRDVKKARAAVRDVLKKNGVTVLGR